MTQLSESNKKITFWDLKFSVDFQAELFGFWPAVEVPNFLW